MSRPQKDGNRWRIRYVDASGVRRSETYRRYDTAQKALNRHLAREEEIRLGVRQAPGPTRTFGELADYYLEHRTSRKKSPKDDRSIINRHLRPFFGHLNLREINVQHIDAFRKASCPFEHPSRRGRVSNQGTVTAKTLHNVLTLLITMFNLAVELGWLDKKPVIKKPRLPAGDYSYIRDQEDIRAFLDSACEEVSGIAEFYACAIYTGMRVGEICGLRWADVDFDRRLITVQRSYESTTKADDVRYVQSSVVQLFCQEHEITNRSLEQG